MRSASSRISRLALVAGLAGAVMVVPLAVAPWGYNPFGPPKLLVLCISAALAAVGIALDPVASSRLAGALRRPPVLVLGVLSGLFVLASMLADDPRAALFGAYPGYEAGLLALGAMLGAGFAAALSAEETPTLLGRSVTVALLFVGVFALIERAGGAAVVGSQAGMRTVSTLGNASNLGLWCAAALGWATHVLLADRRRAWRVAAGAALAAGVAGVILSGSRGAAVAVVAAVLVWAILTEWRSLERSPRIASIALASFVLVAVIAGVSVGSGARASVPGPDTAAGRIAVWSESVPLVAERPFLGFGPGGFGRAYAATTELPLADELGRDRPLEDPHTVLISTAVAAGPLAAVALLAMAALFAVAAWRDRSTGSQIACAAAAATAGFVGLQFHFLTLDVGPLLFASLGVLAYPVRTWSHADRVPQSETARHAHPTALRAAWAGVAMLFAFAAIAAAGVLGADAAMRAGFATADVDWEVSSAHFAKAHARAPWDPAPLWALGRAAREVGGVDLSARYAARSDGIEALREAARIRPGDHRILRDLGDLYAGAVLDEPHDAEAATGALAAYDAALALAPTDPLVWLGKGGVLLTTGETVAAQDALERAVVLSPRLAVGWANLAIARRVLGDDGGAEQAQARAEELGWERGP